MNNQNIRCYRYCRSLNDSKGFCLKYNMKLEFTEGFNQGFSGYVKCKECQEVKGKRKR
jgi:hypothetical protein